MPEKMNLVIKDVILEKWKSKIGYSFNFKDLEELEIIINQFDNHIKYLENKLQQKEDIINKAKEYIINNPLYEEEYDYDYEENMYLSGIYDDDVRRILLKILDNKGE